MSGFSGGCKTVENVVIERVDGGASVRVSEVGGSVSESVIE